MSSQEVELAWAAGFFDGEGCTVARYPKPKKPHHKHVGYITVSVGQSEISVLNRFQQAVDIGKVYGPWDRTPSTKKDGSPSPRKPNWEFRVVSKDAQEVMEKLWPYLSDIKKEQFNRKVREVKEFNENQSRQVDDLS